MLLISYVNIVSSILNSSPVVIDLSKDRESFKNGTDEGLLIPRHKKRGLNRSQIKMKFGGWGWGRFELPTFGL